VNHVSTHCNQTQICNCDDPGISGTVGEQDAAVTAVHLDGDLSQFTLMQLSESVLTWAHLRAGTFLQWNLFPTKACVVESLGYGAHGQVH
jgi:hypothetical protein